jgi:putative transposase
MVRAGVVEDPEEWQHSGYREIQHPRRRNSLIDYAKLMDLIRVSNLDDLRKAHREWVEDRLANGNPFREDLWTESVAVGDDDFIEEVKDRLGARAKGRSIIMGINISFGKGNGSTGHNGKKVFGPSLSRFSVVICRN